MLTRFYAAPARAAYELPRALKRDLRARCAKPRVWLRALNRALRGRCAKPLVWLRASMRAWQIGFREQSGGRPARFQPCCRALALARPARRLLRLNPDVGGLRLLLLCVQRAPTRSVASVPARHWRKPAGCGMAGAARRSAHRC